MKYTLATSLVVALLMNSSEVAGTQMTIQHRHRTQHHAKAVQSESDSESDSEQENIQEQIELESLAVLNERNEYAHQMQARAQLKSMVESQAATLAKVNSQIAAVEKLMAKKDEEDPNWESHSVEMISKLQDPIHNMILSWNDWYMSQNALGAPEKWDPAHNPAHMIKSEVSDVYKAMNKIRALEMKLSKFPMNSGTTNQDWSLLNSLKRELGIPVEFGDDKKALAGEGSMAAKSTIVASF